MVVAEGSFLCHLHPPSFPIVVTLPGPISGGGLVGRDINQGEFLHVVILSSDVEGDSSQTGSDKRRPLLSQL